MTTNDPGGLSPEGDLTLDHDPSRPPAAATNAGLPREIGGFRILGKLGEGGMGIVYEAEQKTPYRKVALKIVRGGHFVDDQYLRMFRRETETLARLTLGIWLVSDSSLIRFAHNCRALGVKTAGRGVDNL